MPAPADHPAAFILTWNPNNADAFPEYERFIRMTAEGNPAPYRWLAARAPIEDQNRLYLLRQRRERGIVAAGYATGEPIAGPHYSGVEGVRPAKYAPLVFERVLPVDQMLSFEKLVAEVPGVDWNNIYESGRYVEPEAAQALNEAWERHLRSLGHVADNATAADLTLVRYAEYTREQVLDIFEPGTKFTPQSGLWGISGTIEIKERPGDFVFFMTLGHKQAHHTFDEGVTLEGVVQWQSQPSRTFEDEQIKKLLSHDPRRNSIYVFLRAEKSGPYLYIGKVRYLWHDTKKEQPVWFHWQILDWNPETAKLPAEAYIDAVPTPDLVDVASAASGDGQPTAKLKKGKAKGQGFVADGPTRLAIELHAMEVATKLYVDNGFDVEDTHVGNPFDLRCSKAGELVHVEVKGTMGDGATVIVTAGEVDHARRPDRRTDLVIVGHVQLARQNGVPVASGGQVVAHLKDWEPIDDQLVVTQYRYMIDDDGADEAL